MTELPEIVRSSIRVADEAGFAHSYSTATGWLLARLANLLAEGPMLEVGPVAGSVPPGSAQGFALAFGS